MSVADPGLRRPEPKTDRERLELLEAERDRALADIHRRGWGHEPKPGA